jgi:uncharacterized protein (TIGR00299 family) protein
MSDSTTQRRGWLDCRSGVSGDMLLGALHDLDAIDIEQFTRQLGLRGRFTASAGTRGGLSGVSVSIAPDDDQPHRRLADVLAIIDSCGLAADVRARARAVFARLAAAEARVHATAPEAVEFHEVGAVDAIVDVLGVCQGVATLALAELVVSPLALGGGQARAGHGNIPVPGPAVLELLAGSALVAHGGPVDVELATPTGVALLVELATGSGPLPAMAVHATGVGLGGRDLPDHPNVLRLVVGTAPVTLAALVDGAAAASSEDDWLLLEANVDDLDPRLWPGVLGRLLEAGAGDAWLTPIVMKKGRPAHTVSVLTNRANSDGAARVLFTESTTIGIRTSEVGKHALDRSWVTVEVDGQRVRVKLARLDGQVVNAVPEYDDIAAAASALGQPAKIVLATATAAASALLGSSPPVDEPRSTAG